jgi:hypothetical protein
VERFSRPGLDTVRSLCLSVSVSVSVSLSLSLFLSEFGKVKGKEKVLNNLQEKVFIFTMHK